MRLKNNHYYLIRYNDISFPVFLSQLDEYRDGDFIDYYLIYFYLYKDNDRVVQHSKMKFSDITELEKIEFLSKLGTYESIFEENLDSMRKIIEYKQTNHVHFSPLQEVQLIHMLQAHSDINKALQSIHEVYSIVDDYVPNLLMA